MRKTFTLLLFLSFLSIAVNAQTRYFKGILQASQEVPANGSAAFGVVIVRYNTATNEFVLTADYQNLSGPISASHIHNAPAGANGPVIFNLSNTGSVIGGLGVNRVLTEAEEVELLAGNLYANVHTSVNLGGEIRAQLTEATLGQSKYFATNLSGANEVPPNASGGNGTVIVLLDKGTNTLYCTGGFQGLGGAVTAGHLHTAPAGSNGSVTFPFSLTLGFTLGVLSKTAAVTLAQIADFEAGNIYANVHTTLFPGGELRGQLALVPDPQIVYFKGLLEGSQETPPNASTAYGVVLARYDLSSNQLMLAGDYQLLGAPASAAHIHTGAPGVAGPITFPINYSGNVSGTLALLTVTTDAQEADLLAGNFYVNVHNALFPGGEVRAQLLQTTEGMTRFAVDTPLTGLQEVPPNASVGTGGVITLLDRGTGMLYLTGGFTDLGSASTLAHLHKAAVGANGPVIFPLRFTPGFTLGVLDLVTPVTPDQIADIDNGLYYANVHSAGFPGGEVRTQLAATSTLPVKLISFNGYRNRQNVALTWEVANQQNFRNYTIEQLNTQTKGWINKGTVAASNASLKYDFADVPLLLSDILYYRLKMTDMDGKTAYSPIVKINFKTGKAQLSLLSNPVKNNLLQFQLTGIAPGVKANASLIDMTGKLMVKASVVNAGTNSIDISGLSKGMYKLIVVVDNETIETSFLK